jgi:hypothetical protein
MTADTMLTRPQRVLNSPIPLNDLGVQIRHLPPKKFDDLHDVLLTGAIAFNTKCPDCTRGSDGIGYGP